ncbi:MAG: glycosyltransferase [Verrucomicrobiia bacterium]
MEGTPAVSCMCLTYGRPHLLAEAIQSFLQQDYSGQKELIVLNDLDCQTLRFSHPEVRIINVSKRFRTVGEKRNACAALATHDLLFVWDDDDIYLPHRLKLSVQMFDPAKRFFKPRNALVLNNCVLQGPDRNLFHSSSCWSRSLFDQVRGYAHVNSGQDLEIEQQFERVIGKDKNTEVRPTEIFYIYRWAGTTSFHLSGFGMDKPGQKPGNEKVGDYVAQAIKAGRIQSGEIVIEPHWACNYTKLAAEYLAPTFEASRAVADSDHGAKAAREVTRTQRSFECMAKPVSQILGEARLHGEHSFVPLLDKWLKNLKPRNVVEWGPGLSTALIKAVCPDAKIVTIESQGRFYERAMKEHGSYARVVLANIRQYGPSDYSCWPIIHMPGVKFDLVFVDGRQRVSCLITAMKVLSREGVVMLHDATRREYQHGLALFDMLESVESTVVLRPKKEILDATNWL